MSKRVAAAAVVWLLPAAMARGGGLPQDPACAEFPVNTYTTGFQNEVAVAAGADGSFVVVWNSSQDDEVDGIFGQRFGAGGVPQGGEFHVNTYTTSIQVYPTVASLSGGGFVVAWHSYAQDGDSFGVFGQRFDATGAPQGSEFRINTTTTGAQADASVAATTGGGFVVTWDAYQVFGQVDVFGQRFDPSGSPAGPEFQVNTFTGGTQQHPQVAGNPNGGFAVVWVSQDQDGDSTGIYGQRYLATGQPQGAEFRVNTYTSGSQVDPSLAFDAAGNFIVVWTSPHDGSGDGIFAQRFDAAGVPQGAELQVNASTAAGQFQPGVAADSTGGFVVTWASESGDGDGLGILGRRVSGAGVPQGQEFRVNTYTTQSQFLPRVAATGGGAFVVAWTSQFQDGSGEGVYASLDCARLYTVTPCRLVDTRNPPGPTGGPPLGASTTRTFPITGACAIPADARAVALNVTAVNPTATGNLRFYPAGQAAPLASTINFAPGRTRANNAVVLLGANGQVSVQCDMLTGSTNLVLDVFGYFKR